MPDRRPTELGERLRRAREARGVSLRQVANVTRISVRALEAIEQNDRSRLPGGIFTRAFVRAYATEVGLDPETTVHAFFAQSPDDSVADIAAGRSGDASHPPTSRWVRVAVLVLVALALSAAGVYGAMWWRAARAGTALEAPPGPPRPGPAVRTRDPWPAPALVRAATPAVRMRPRGWPWTTVNASRATGDVRAGRPGRGREGRDPLTNRRASARDRA